MASRYTLEKVKEIINDYLCDRDVSLETSLERCDELLSDIEVTKDAIQSDIDAESDDE